MRVGSSGYDPQGRRTRYTKGSTLKTYFYQGLDLLSDGSSKFLHGVGVDEPLEIKSTTLNANYLSDHLGSTSQLLDSTTALSKARLDYKSYGKLEGDITNPQPTNPFTYTGRGDDGTGLMYYRARYYDPELEVFISQDPLGDAQRYVGGNPLILIDPLGLQADAIFINPVKDKVLY
jgi:RHS repeat-associated protein